MIAQLDWVNLMFALAAFLTSVTGLVAIILTHGKVSQVKDQVATPNTAETLGQVVEKLANGSATPPTTESGKT